MWTIRGFASASILATRTRSRPSEPPEAWLRACAPFLSHVHLHNNEGGRDLHAALMDGKMDCAALLRLLAQLAPEATCTLELMQDRPSLRWLEEQELLE